MSCVIYRWAKFFFFSFFFLEELDNAQFLDYISVMCLKIGSCIYSPYKYNKICIRLKPY